MTRPITLFTGQWADLPLEEVARLVLEEVHGSVLACLDRLRKVVGRARIGVQRQA
jgi:hypothetical protein